MKKLFVFISALALAVSCNKSDELIYDVQEVEPLVLTGYSSAETRTHFGLLIAVKFHIFGVRETIFGWVAKRVKRSQRIAVRRSLYGRIHHQLLVLSIFSII